MEGRRTKVKAKHVLMIVQNLPVPFDRRVWQEATTLQSAGFEVTVICPKKKMYRRSFEIIEGITVLRYPLLLEAKRNPVAFGLEFLFCWIASFSLSMFTYFRRPFQVIHACNPPDTFFLLALLYRPLGVKFVFDHHDLSPEMYLAKGGRRGGLLHRGLTSLERWTMHTAHHVIAVNESHREIARKRGGVAEDRITVIRSGPRGNWVKRTPVNPALKRGRQFLVVYLGEMCEQDGVDRLLEAIKYFRDDNLGDAHFALIGGGPDQPRMVRLSNSLGLDNEIEFTGRISDDKLQGYLSSADICVDPDPWTEWSNLSTMNKILEYMSFAQPIVAFDLLEHRRSAEDAAIYVKPNDSHAFALAIRDLLENPELRTKMGRYAERRFSDVLSWDHASTKLIALYTRLFSILE
jgi:glycosyltransferase involved in cell wall biosynthesis